MPNRSLISCGVALPPDPFQGMGREGRLHCHRMLLKGMEESTLIPDSYFFLGILKNALLGYGREGRLRCHQILLKGMKKRGGCIALKHLDDEVGKKCVRYKQIFILLPKNLGKWIKCPPEFYRIAP